MIECLVTHPTLPGLFDSHIPNNPALWAVFEGRHQGRAVVDELHDPKQCVLRTDAVLTYTSQSVSQAFLSQAIGFFKKVGPIWLIHNTGDASAPEGYRILPRVEFYDYDPGSTTLAELHMAIPNGFQIRVIDLTLLKRCAWRDDMAFYCGSLENFIKYGLGVCLMHDDEIIVEAYASALGNPYAEIGAITHEGYRGKSYAPITIAFLIEILEQRGYHAYWSCDADNLPSARVARKLGFKVEKSYEIWEYEPELG